MSARDDYEPGPADRARIEKDGAQWVLVVQREFTHAPEMVWAAITDPAQLREWAPFDADAALDRAGQRVRLTTAGAPMLHVTETTIERAEPPRLLVYNWGGSEMRWELEPHGAGTRLTLWTRIDRAYIAMGAAGWHLCLDVLHHLLDGRPMGRIVGPDAMAFAPWQALFEGYTERFGAAKA